MSDGRDIFTSIDENATGAVTADAVKTWVSANEEKVRGLLEAGAQYFAEHFDSNTADVTAEDFCEVWKKASAAQELAKIVPGVGAKDKSELPPTSYTEFVPEDANFKFTLGHQEMTRVMKELEAIFRSQPCDWLPVEAMGNLLSQELGYEDVAEFEDALEGEFSEFVKGLPNAELSTNERGTPVLRLKQEVMGPPRKMILQVTERKHLWYVLMQAEDARITLPEIEFEFQPMGERKIDTIYNHIGSAVWNLGEYVRTAGLVEDTENKIMDTILLLNKMLDVEHPFTVVLEDPTSRSLWQPADEVKTEYIGTNQAQAA